MTDLERRARAVLPLDYETVERLHRTTTGKLRDLCESHERLRLEFRGAESLIKEDRKRIEDIEEVLRYVLDEVTVCIPSGEVANPIIRRIEAALYLDEGETAEGREGGAAP